MNDATHGRNRRECTAQGRPSLWTKLRRHGLLGAVRFVAGRLRERRWRAFFLRAAAWAGSRIPERGFTLVANFTSPWSQDKVMRDLARALKDCGIPFQTFDVRREGALFSNELSDILTPRRDFDIRRFDHAIDITGTLPPIPGVSTVRLVFWEFDTGLLEANPSLRGEKRLVAMSDYVVAVLRREFSDGTSIGKILYPFRFEEAGSLPDPEAVRLRFGLPSKGFFVFFNFDFASSVFRKNPDGAVRAFAEAFPNAANAFLVFKTTRADRRPEAKRSLLERARELGIADRFFLLDGFVAQREVYALTNACDVYMSLHRGEGFGLGVAEAMSLGKPAVVSDCGSTNEFCIDGAALRVPVRIRDVRPEEIDHPSYSGVRQCPEPDVEEAARALRALYDDEELRSSMGARAKQTMEEHFSRERFRASVESFLADGRDAPETSAGS